MGRIRDFLGSHYSTFWLASNFVTNFYSAQVLDLCLAELKVAMAAAVVDLVLVVWVESRLKRKQSKMCLELPRLSVALTARHRRSQVNL